ncbi:MAG: apolipoprotein N-acyltransferase, partial [candidate division Zixibacteria bacterium]|nr:apolipoprotein N-acyltransferase [candidate division Zixibacteria bacterium]
IADSGAVLHVWPETSAPAYLSHDARHRYMLSQTARQSGAYQLVGALGANTEGERVRHYNSCYLFEPDGHLQLRYDKVKLVPFTEQVPYQDDLPFMRREFLFEYLTFIKTYDIKIWSDFVPGDSLALFSMGDTTFGVLICFESAFPEYARTMIRQGADFVLGITNDTWFGHSVGIHMHSRFFVTRAVENRCWMVRVANSGLSYVVDGYGRIWNELPLDARMAAIGRVNRLDGFSVFTVIGDVAGKVSFLLTVLAAAILLGLWILRKTGLLRRSA